jgi:CRISPR/Cas system Type II protein with McrA/HNH and RuvC-like nuclease domain
MLNASGNQPIPTNGTNGHGERLGSSPKITAVQLLAKLESQQMRCALTGRELSPEFAAPDHIVPLSRGGKNVIANIQIVHSDANRAKHGMMEADFIALCREVADWSRR